MSATTLSATATTLTTQVPSGATTGPVTVTVGGLVSNGMTFTVANAGPPPTLSSLSPNVGSVQGGQQTTLIGTGFVAGTTVKIGNKPASVLTLVSATSMIVQVPASVPGPADVVVTNVNGDALIQNGYTYVSGPSQKIGTITPTMGLINIPRNTPVTVSFSRPVDRTTITTSTFAFTQGATPVSGSFGFSFSDTVVTFQPAATLAASTAYTLSLTQGIKSIDGVPLDGTFFGSFTTGTGTDTVPPTVTISPANGATNVPYNTTILLTFSKPINPNTVNSSTVLVTSQGQPVAGSLTFGQQNTFAVFTPAAPFFPTASVTVTVTGQVTDVAGNALQGAGGVGTSVVATFTTGSTADRLPPIVLQVVPANGATGISVNTSLSVTFSKSVNPLTITPSTVQVTSGGAPLAGTFAFANFNQIVTFLPAAPLPPVATVNVSISHVADVVGNVMVLPLTSSFQTQSAIDNIRPNVVRTNPGAFPFENPWPSNTNLPLNFKPMIAFDKRMNPSTINSTTWSLAPLNAPAIPSTMTVAPDGQSAILTPTQLLLPNTTYGVGYTSGMQDLVGNSLLNPGMISFSTGPVTTDQTPPTVVDVSPRTGTQVLPVNASVTVLFSEPVSFPSITPETVVLSTGGVPVATQLTLEQNNTVLRIRPANLLLLQANKFYELTVTTGVLDLAGNPLAASFGSSFTTGSATDTTAPTVTTFTPPLLATGVSRQTTASATFSKPIDPITVTSATFSVGGVPGTSTVSADLKTVTFTPTNPLFAGTGYNIMINGVEDLTGNKGTGSSVFTTALAPGTVAATLPTTATGTPNPATLYSDGQTTTVITVNNISYQPGGSGPVTLVPNGTVIGLLPFDSNQTFTGGGTLLDGTPSQADPRVKLYTTLGGGFTATYQSPNAPLPLPSGGVNIVSVDAASAPVAVIGTASVSFVRGNSFLPTVNPSALLANGTSSGQMSVIVRNPSGTPVPAGESVALTFEPVFPPVNAPSIGGGTINGGTVAPDARFKLFTTTAGGRIDFTYTPPTLAASQSAVSALQMANVDASENLVSQIRTSDGFNDRFFLNGLSGFSGPQPTLLAVSPATGESGVGTNATVDLLFSESLDPTTINASTVSMTSGAAIPGTYTVLASAQGPNTLVRFTPTTPFAPSSTVTVAITVGIKNPAGIPLLSANTITFSTGTGPDTTPPTVVQLFPANGQSGVATNRGITAQFSKPMNATTITAATFTVSTGGSPISGRVTVGSGPAGPNSVATFTPIQSLNPNAGYTVSLSAAILDTALNPLAATTAAFTAGSGVDTFQPSVTNTSPRLVRFPTDATISIVPLDAKVSVQFNKPMHPLTLTANNIQLTQQVSGITGTALVPGSLAMAPDFQSVTFTPAQPLIPNGLFSLNLSAGLTDLAGNPLLPTLNIYFMTGVASTDPTPLTVTISPVNGDTGITLNAPVVLQFSKAIAPTTVTNATVVVSGGSGPLPGTFSIEQNNRVVRWLPANLLQLAPNTVHTVTLSTGITDLEGRPMGSGVSMSFTTGAAIDTTPPMIVAAVPANNATGVARSATTQVTLNKQIDPATAVLGSTVFLSGPGAAGSAYTSSVPAALAVSADRRTLTVTPTNQLVANQVYSLSLNGVEDLAGNKTNSSVSTSFTTAMAAGTILAALPTSAVVMANPTTLFADGVQSTTILVTNVALSNGSLVPNGTTIAVTALPALNGNSAGGVILGGTPSPTDPRFQLFTTSGGGITFTYVTPNRPDLVQGGSGSIQVAPVDAAGTPVSGFGGVLIGQGTVTLVRGTLVTASFNPPTLLANGTSTANATLTLLSGTGSTPAPASAQLALTVQPVFTASAGGTLTGGTPATDPRFSIFTTLPNGEIDVTYTAPVLASGTATAVFQAAAVDASGTILREIPFQSFINQLALSATSGFVAPQPVVTALSPASSETGVGTNAVVMAKFSQPVNPATVTPATFSVTSGGSLAGAFTIGASELGPNTLVTWRPAAPLPTNSSVTVALTSGIQNTAGEPLLVTSLSSATFSTGLGPDTMPPTVVQVNPPNGVLSVGTNSVITVEFSEPINATTVTTATISVAAGGVPIAGRVSVIAGPRGPNTRAVFTPSQLLGSTLTYTLTVSTGITDTALNPLAAPFTASFGTGTGIDNFQPSIVSVSPPAGMTGVPLNARGTVRFNKPMNPLTLNATTFGISGPPYNSVPGTITMAPDLLSVTFTPSVVLLPNTSYSINLSNSVQDLAGNPLLNPGALVGSFVTGTGAPDIVNPQVLLVSPAMGSTGVPLNGNVLLQFSKPLAPTSVQRQTVAVSAGGVPVAGTLTLEQNDTVVRWRPAPLSQLAASTLYTVTVTTGVTDVVGNPLAAPFTSTFTSGTNPDTTAPTVVTVTPVNGATNVPRTQTVTVTMNKPIDPATVTVLDPVLVYPSPGGTVSVTTGSAGFGPFVPGIVAVSPDRTTLTFTPSVPLLANQFYTVSVTGVEDVAGNKSNVTSSFTTALASGTNLTLLPTTAVVTAAPAQLFANGQTSATVTITNIARNGILVPDGTVVGVSADPSLYELGEGGTIIGGVPSSQDPRFRLFTTVNGSVTLTYQSPNRPDVFNGGKGYVWVASVDAAGAPINALGSTAIMLTRGTSAAIATNPSSLLANGTSYATVVISVTDNVGGTLAPVPAGATYAVTTAPVFTTSSVPGTLSGGTVAPDNRFTLYQTIPGGTIPLTYTTPLLAAGQTASSQLQLAKVDSSGTIVSSFATAVTGGQIQLNGSTGPTSPQPTVVALSPANGQTGVGTNATIAAKFSLPVNRASVTLASNGSFTVTQGGGLVPGMVSFSASELGPDTIMTFTPAAPWPLNASVTVALTAGIQSVSGQALGAAASSTFSIGLQADTVAPTVTLTNPVAGSGAVPTNSFLSIGFSEPINATTVNPTTFAVTAGGTLVAGQFTFAAGPAGPNAIVTFLPNQLLTPNTSYLLAFGNGLTDTASNGLIPATVPFTTTGGIDNVPPTIMSSVPTSGVTGFPPTGTSITITLSEPVNPLTVSNTTVFFYGASIPATVALSSNNTVITVTPSQPFFAGAPYSVQMQGVQDVAGNPLAFTGISFTTALAPGTMNLPTSATVVANPPQLFANGLTTSQVTISNIKNGSTLVPNGTQIAVSADPSLSAGSLGGTISGASVGTSVDGRFLLFQTLGGQVVVTYTSPNFGLVNSGASGQGTVEVAAIDLSTRPASLIGSGSVSLLGASSAVGTATPSTLPANGTATAALTVTVRDGAGNLVPDGTRIGLTAAPVFTPSVGGTILGGTASPVDPRIQVFTTVGGQITATYQAGPTPGTVAIQGAAVNGSGVALRLLGQFSLTLQ